MKILKIALQMLGFVVLIGAVTIGTLRIQRSSGDGATVVFPGGEMVAGELHTGPEPDWSFTDDIFTIELQLNDPMATRRIFIIESEGKIYVVSGYMKSFLGKIWKEWRLTRTQVMMKACCALTMYAIPENLFGLRKATC